MVAERAQTGEVTDETHRQQFVKQWRTGWTALPHDVLFRDDLTMGDLKVYMALASFCWGSKRDCHPSRQLLMDMTGLSGKTTSVAIAHLECIGWVRCKRGKNRQDGNNYVLTGPLVPLAASPISPVESCEVSTHGHVKGLPLASEETTHDHVKGLPIKQTKIETDELKQKDGAAPHGAGADAPPAAQNHAPSSKVPKAATPAWVDPLIDAIGAAIGWKQVGDKTRATWRPLLAPLKGCLPEERCRFPGWLVSGNGHWKGRGFQLTHSLTLECEAFVSAGCPAGKPQAVARNGSPAGQSSPPTQQEAALFEERKAHFAAKRGGNLVGWDSYDPPPRQN